MNKGKITLNFKKVAEDGVAQVAAATMGEKVLPSHGDIPETREELLAEIDRAHAFMKSQDLLATSNARYDARKEMQQRDQEIRAQIKGIFDRRSNRLFMGLGGLNENARREVEKLEAEHKDLAARYQAHETLTAKVTENRDKTVKRLVRLKDALKKCAGVTVMQAEEPAAQESPSKKISLNFKRVTGAQTEAMAEGTLVTGGFDLAGAKAKAVAEEESQKMIRRIMAERREAEERAEEEARRKKWEADEARYERERRDRDRAAAEAEHQRRMAEEYARNQDYNKPGYGSGGFSSKSSAW